MYVNLHTHIHTLPTTPPPHTITAADIYRAVQAKTEKHRHDHKRGWRTGDQTQESPAAQLSHHVAWCEEGWVSGNSTSMWTRVIMALVHIYTETQERIPRPIIWILMRLMATSSVTQPPLKFLAENMGDCTYGLELSKDFQIALNEFLNEAVLHEECCSGMGK